MKKIIRLTESDLTRLVNRMIKEYSPYDRSIDDLEGSFQKKYDDKYLRYRNDDVEITSHNPESEADSVLRRDHEDKINKLKTYYKEKIIYDFFQNINLTPEENDKLEDLDEKLSNPNLGSDKIERYKNLKRQIYLGHLNEYLNSLDNRYFGQYFISNNYDYFKDKIKDFAYNDNLPSEPVAPTSPNLIQRTANKVKGYFGLSENKRLSERDLTRIVKRVIREQDDTIQPTAPQTIDLKKIREIFVSKGFNNTPSTGYSFHMDKPNNGPVKNKSGGYVASYETYIPLKQPKSGFGITDGKTKQLWVDKRGGLKPGTDEPNTYNLIFDLNPDNLIMQSVKNGTVISKTTITVDDFYKQLQDYK